MTGCHNCPVADEIAAGAFENAAWDEVPCSTCDVMTGLGHAIEYDDSRAAPENKGAADVAACPGECLPVTVLQDLVAGLLLLPAELRDVVAWRFAGMSYPDIAKVQGISTAAVEKRHRRALALWPALEAMFAVKVSKQGRRKRHAA